MRINENYNFYQPSLILGDLTVDMINSKNNIDSMILEDAMDSIEKTEELGQAVNTLFPNMNENIDSYNNLIGTEIDYLIDSNMYLSSNNGIGNNINTYDDTLPLLNEAIYDYDYSFKPNTGNSISFYA